MNSGKGDCLGALTLRTAENSNMIYSQPPTYRVPPQTRIQPTSDGTVFMTEKNLCMNGPMHFKPVLQKGLYIMQVFSLACPFLSYFLILLFQLLKYKHSLGTIFLSF